MKKIIFSFIICFASIQCLQAIPSNLGESLREYQAILDSSLIPEVISQNEFIIDIRRKTKNLDQEIVFYEIVTRTSATENGEILPAIEANIQTYFKQCFHHSDEIKKYRATLLFTENPQIGPPIITVESIKPIDKHSCKKQLNENQ